MSQPKASGSSARSQSTQQRNATKSDKELLKELDTVLEAQKNLNKAFDQPSLHGPEAGRPVFDEKKFAMELKEKLGKHTKEHEKEVGEVKEIVHHRLRNKVYSDRDEYIEARVRTEIGRQIQEQVEAQISDFLPIPLGEQQREAQAHLEKAKKALENSEARLTNGDINATDTSDWSRPLKKVSKDDGTMSKLFPNDLASLFRFEEEKMKALMKDFDLNIDTSKNGQMENINRFIQYIGVRGRFTAHQPATGT